MTLEHENATALEAIICRAFSCDRAKIAKYIAIDHFVAYPFDAALIVLTHLWEKADPFELENFVYRWERKLLKAPPDNGEIDAYIHELDEFVTRLLRKE